jgi:hypothetical protein
MAVTRLKRKERRNSDKATRRKADIKLLTQVPVIKKIDVEAIKKSFAEKSANA